VDLQQSKRGVVQKSTSVFRFELTLRQSSDYSFLTYYCPCNLALAEACSKPIPGLDGCSLTVNSEDGAR
jgi:hypothetical protein